MTLLMSVLATCDRLRTASSAEKDKRLRGFGYNGSVSGDGHCDDVGHLMVDGHCERTLHGEENLREKYAAGGPYRFPGENRGDALHPLRETAGERAGGRD